MFLGPRSQGQKVVWGFIILLDLYYDSSESEILLVKIRARVCRPLTPKSSICFRIHDLTGFIL